ncbi:MAG TPA: SCO family protein [Bryobacteraceae bacterium]|nr:SCO family protein [Bryobacteraceae bacterium]
MNRIAVAALILLASCASRLDLPFYGLVPEFHLTDQSGRPFASAQHLKNKVWVANFIFTNCAGPCPRMSAQMRDLKKTLAEHDDLRFVSFTIDPARDTPEVLARYGKRFSADPQRWYLLTGPLTQLHELSRNVFKLGNVDGQLEHSTRFVLMDRRGRIRGFYDSADPEKMRQLAGDIQLALRSTA